MITHPHRRRLLTTTATLLVFGSLGCGQRGTPPSPDAGATTATATGSTSASGPDTSTTGTCLTQVTPGPLLCGLTRASVVSVSFSPGNDVAPDPPTTGQPGARTVVTSVVRTTEEGAVESAEVWDPRTGRVLHTLVKDLEHHGGLQTDWTADGQHVAIAGVGDSHFGFRIYDAAGFVPLHEDAEIRYQFPCALEIDPSETRVAVTTLLGTAAIHDLDTGRSLAALETNPMRAAGHVCSVLQWSGDGKAIQVEGLRESTGLRPLPKRTTRDPRQSIPSEEELVQASFAPKGDLAAFLDRKGNVRLFGRNGVVPLRVIAAGKDVPPPADSTAPVVRALSWRPDATALATWDHTGRVRVWDPAKGTLVRELRASGPRLEGLPDPEMEDARLTWSPDGRWLTFWSGERPELWSLDDGTQRLASQSAPKPDIPAHPEHAIQPRRRLAGRGPHPGIRAVAHPPASSPPPPITGWIPEGSCPSRATISTLAPCASCG